MKQPLVAPLAALAAGIWAARFAELTFGETLLSVTMLALLALAALRLRGAFAGAAACLAGFFLVGALLASLPPPGDLRDDPALITRVLERENADLHDPIRLRGWVREPPEDLGDADRFVLEAESIFRATPVRGGVRVTVNRTPATEPLQLAYGRRVEFLARLRLPHNFQNPGSFDFVDYLNRQGIFVHAVVRPGVPILALEGDRGSGLMGAVWAARLWARARFSSLFASHADLVETHPRGENAEGARRAGGSGATAAAGILDAMLLGDRNALDRQTTTDFQRTGVYHALVISGMQVGLLALVLLRLMRLLRLPPNVAAAVTTGAVAAYTALVGAGVPVLRSAWMLTAYLVTALVFRKRRALNVIAGTAFCFLVADPRLLFDAGFQLSFVSVALIAAIAVPALEKTLEPRRLALRDIWNLDRDLHAPPQVAGQRVALRTWLEALAAVSGLSRPVISFPVLAALRVLIGAAELVVVSLVIQAGLAWPLAVHFQRVSWSGVSANLLVIPLLSVVTPMGLLALLSGWHFAAAAALWAAGTIGAVVQWHAGHMPLETRVPPPPGWLGALFGLSLVLVALSLAKGRRQFAAAAASTALLLILVLHPFPPQLVPRQLEMTVLDVGQGDSIFVALPDGETLVVDGGGQPDFRDPTESPSRREPIDIGEAVVSPYLWSRSIKRLDIVAVTHADQDHLGGIPALLRNFQVGELWLGEGTFPKEYRGITALAQQREVPIRRVHEGQNFALGTVRVEVLGPSQTSQGRNDQSVILRLGYGDRHFLLTGDIEGNREQELVSSGVLTASDILKVAHHGSRTSSQWEFLEIVKPAFAVISAGFENLYGHPHPAVLERLNEAHATVFRTDQEGLVTFTTDGYRVRVDTFRRESVAAERMAELVAGR